MHLRYNTLRVVTPRGMRSIETSRYLCAFTLSPIHDWYNMPCTDNRARVSWRVPLPSYIRMRSYTAYLEYSLSLSRFRSLVYRTIMVRRDQTSTRGSADRTRDLAACFENGNLMFVRRHLSSGTWLWPLIVLHPWAYVFHNCIKVHPL